MSVFSEGIPGKGCIFTVCLSIHSYVPDSRQTMSVNSSISSDNRHQSNGTSDDCPIFVETLPDTSPTITPSGSMTSESNNINLSPNSSIISTHSLSQSLPFVALCVDDSALNRKFIGRFLEKYFSVIHYCVNGLEAVEFVRNTSSLETISIIFMDNVMPVMDGLEATTQIRGLGYTGPIIGVTGNCLPEQIEEFLSHGASLVIQKPITLETFGKIVCGKYIYLLNYNNQFSYFFRSLFIYSFIYLFSRCNGGKCT